MKKVFQRGKIYSTEEIGKLCVENNMIPVDCLKDDNQITVEFEEKTIYEFTCLNCSNRDKFVLTWSKFDNN